MLLLLGLLVAPAAAQVFTTAAPINWASSNVSSRFGLLRSPEFTLRAAPTSASLVFAALGSPRPPAGTTQAKLLGAAMVYVNGILVAGGPGHNVPTDAQVARSVDVLPFLRGDGADNTVGIASFFDSSYAKGEVPQVQAALAVVDAQGVYNATVTGASWTAWGADAAFRPTGNAGVSWYPVPNASTQTSPTHPPTRLSLTH